MYIKTVVNIKILKIKNLMIFRQTKLIPHAAVEVPEFVHRWPSLQSLWNWHVAKT